MTAVLDRTNGPTGWAAMPGWTIFADLTPPELIASRRLRVLRRFIGAALLLVMLLCAAGYVYAIRQHSSAADEATAAAARTTQLEVSANRYSGITRIEAVVGSIRGEVASVMSADIDVPKLVDAIRGSLPSTMALKDTTVTLNAAGTAVATDPGLNMTGHNVIGTVTVDGSGKSLDDLPAYVDRLTRVPGIVNVVPTSNATQQGTVAFSVTFGLTDVLYTHRYDVTATGGK